MENKNFVWTDELVKEFAYRYKNLPMPVYDPINEFKKSKEVKEDYQILSFINSKDYIFILNEEGYYSNINDTKPCTWRTLEHTLNFATDCKIHSVKRLSDGEVIAVNDVVDVNYGNSGLLRKVIIQGFDLKSGIIVVHSRGESSLDQVVKVSKPLFTTENGVEIFEGDTYWAVDKSSFEFWYSGAASELFNSGKEKYFAYFATEEAAKEYILMNKPLLSLNDILDAWGDNPVCNRELYKNDPMFLNFKNVAKKKLNQQGCK